MKKITTLGLLGVLCCSMFSFSSTAKASSHNEVLFSHNEVMLPASYSSYEVVKVDVFSNSSKYRLIQHAKNMLHKPYRYGGTTPKGFDASGFVYYVYQKHGLKVPRTVLQQYKQGEYIPQENLTVGDLVFFNPDKKGNPTFVGIYAGNDKFYAVTVKHGVQELKLSDPYWKKRFVGAKRLYYFYDSFVL